MMKKLMILLAALFVGIGLSAQTAPEEDLDLQYATELLKPGTPAPDFILKDIAGKQMKISDFRGRKVVLVFWASWCPDCRGEVPELKAMHAKADPSKVAFVSVSFDRKLETLVQFATENYLPGVQLFDPAGMKESAIGSAYHVKWIPSLYLIDEEGKVQMGTVVASKVAAALGTSSAPSLKKGLCTEEGCAE